MPSPISSNYWGWGGGKGRAWMDVVDISWNCFVYFCHNTVVSYPILYVQLNLGH